MTAEQQTLIARIQEMEDRYQELTNVLGELDIAIEQYKDFKEDIDILKDYMWKSRARVTPCAEVALTPDNFF